MSEKELTEKYEEIAALAAQFIPENAPDRDQIISDIVDNFCNLTAPQYEMMMHDITLYSGHGSSRKPGNIRLNWRKLLEKMPDMILTGAGVSASPVLIILAALSIWNGVRALTEIELSENHATALYVMWENRNPRNQIPEEEAFTKTNEYLKTSGKDELSKQVFAETINELIRLKCIELNDGIVWLREWVEKPY